MFRQVMPLLFFFFIFPTFIYGLNCGAGGTCYGSKDVGTPFALAKKDCPDACVSFKCFVDDGQIMEGAGCYEDFANTCKYTRTTIKDQIKKNIQKSAIREYDVYFTSCNDNDGCATNGFDPWIINDSSDKTFGNSYKGEEGLACKYDNKPLAAPSTVKCGSMINCESGKEYQNDGYSNPVYGPNRTSCDACIKFTCTPDGKTVTSGYGCYQDFEEACKFLGDDVKQNVKQNIKDSFYYDKNYIIFSCSDSDNCQLFSDPFLYYFQVNKNAENAIIFDKNSDEICLDKYSFTTKPATDSPQFATTSLKNVVTVPQTDAPEVFTTINPSPTGAANGQFDAFKLQKIIFFGLTLIYLW